MSVGLHAAATFAYLILFTFHTECSENIAFNQTAYQESTGNQPAWHAVDGDLNPDLGSGSCTHTVGGTPRPWWAVDLQWRRTISHVKLTNRKSPGTGTAYRRLRTFHIGLTDVSPLTVTPALTNYAECAYVEGPVGNGATESFSCHNGGVMGRFLIVQVEHNDVLTICEAQVYESRGAMWFKALRGHVLSGHVMRMVTTKSRITCSERCVQEVACSSFNYHAVSGSCELNDATYDEEQSDVSASAGWAWYNRRV